MYKKWTKFFAIAFFLLASLAFFVPNKVLAQVCLYFPSEAAKQQSIQQFGFPKFTCIEGDAAVQSCMNICNGSAVGCSNISNFTTCAQYESDAQHQQQQAAQDQARYTAEDTQRLLRGDPTLIDNALNQGECLCSVGQQNAPITALGGLPIDACYDREDSANGALYNCRWVYNEEIKPALDKNINDLDTLGAKILREENPLRNYKSTVRDLNKLRATSVQEFLGIAIKLATGIMGTIALSMMIYGGFLWLTSAGNASQIEKAQNVIFYGALGIFVIFGSYALVNFVFDAVNPINTTPR